jgi:hypothetical protein
MTRKKESNERMDTNTRGALADRNFFIAQPILEKLMYDDEVP